MKDKLSSWGLELAPDLVRFDGRILPSETIVTANAKKHDSGSDANWDRVFRSNQMLQSVDLTNWAVIMPRRVSNDAKSFALNLSRCARGMGYTITQPHW